MSKRIDLTNQVFGYWKVISFDQEKTNNHGSYWICKCQLCGEIKSVRSTHLRSGKSTSCGCSMNKISKGQTFGYLEAISINEERSGKGKGNFWNCYCHNCGNYNVVNASNLILNRALSCGCIKMSKGEYEIEEYLKQNNIKYKKQYSFPDLKGENNYPLKFDFLVYLNVPILIEFQGKQHYEAIDFYGGKEGLKKQQKRDNLKREYCKNKNILLYEISYKDNLIIKMEELINGRIIKTD